MTTTSVAILPRLVKPNHIMRNPDRWIGKRIPHNMKPNFGPMFKYDFCDSCHRWFKMDDLHGFPEPQSDADWMLLGALHVDPAEGFCEECLSWLEKKADEVDPFWKER